MYTADFARLFLVPLVCDPSIFPQVRMISKAGKKFAYVEFESPDAVEQALGLDRVPIHGRPIFISQ